MVNIDFNPAFWAQSDGSYTDYTLSNDGTTCTLTGDVNVTDGSVPEDVFLVVNTDNMILDMIKL